MVILSAVVFLAAAAAADVDAGVTPIVFEDVARTACAYDAVVGRYSCDATRDVALELEATTSPLPAGVTATFSVRDNEHCLAPGIDVVLTASVADVVVDGAGLALELDGRAVSPTLLKDAAVLPATAVSLSSTPVSVTVTDAPKALTPCWRVRGVKLTVPVVVAGVTHAVVWQADLRRHAHSRQIAVEHTPRPPALTSTAPTPPPGYPGFVPAADAVPQIVATSAGVVAGAGVGVGAVFGLGAVLPGLFDGAPAAAAILVAAGAVVGAWAGNTLVPPQPHPQAEAFARYELDRDEHDARADVDAAVTRQLDAWRVLHDEAGVPLAPAGVSPAP